MKLALIFTNDWELYGDGSGDYFEVQHQPLIDLTSLMDGYGAKLSIMAEIFQQVKHEELSSTNPDFKKIAEAWKDILREAFTKGHDVQLHIHPQWNEAKLENNEWVLGDNWSIGKRSKDQIEAFIQMGKSYLESTLQEVDSNYKCEVYRAGAYYIEPSTNVIDTLVKNGFICDTSVTKGTYVDNYYDYRKAYSNILPWGIGSDGVTKKVENSSLIEIPINSAISLDSEAFKKFLPDLYYKLKFGVSLSEAEKSWMKERDKVKSVRYPVSRRAYKKHENKNISWYVNKIFSVNAIQLDYDYVPSCVFVKILKNILSDKQITKYKNKNIIIPVVASGHVKDMHNTDNVKRILEGIKNELSDKVEFWTISEAAKYAKENLI